MNVLVICIGGISTNVLVTRLNAYAKSQAKIDDFFRAVSIHNYADILPDFDIVLLAPQAQLFQKSIESQCENYSIPLILLKEQDFSLSDSSSIYKAIIEIKQAPNLHQKADFPKIGISFFRYVFLNSIFSSLLILSLGLVALIFSSFFDWDLLAHTVNITIGAFSIYLCLAIGFYSGKYMKINPLVTSLITFGSVLMVFPMSGNGIISLTGSVLIQTDFIILRDWNIIGSPIIVMLALTSSLIFIMCYRKGFMRDKINTFHPQMASYITSIIPSTIVIAVFLAIRLIAVSLN